MDERFASGLLSLDGYARIRAKLGLRILAGKPIVADPGQRRMNTSGPRERTLLKGSDAERKKTLEATIAHNSCGDARSPSRDIRTVIPATVLPRFPKHAFHFQHPKATSRSVREPRPTRTRFTGTKNFHFHRAN